MEELREILREAILKLYNVDFDVEIAVAPENVEADFSSNVALKLAKVLHKNPVVIASEIAPEDAFVTPPGFINFKLNNEILREKVRKMQDFHAKSLENREKSPENQDFEGKTVICEFSDPNPFKVLHVGHLYTSVVGDAISRLYEYAGARVVRANFGGDVGLHVAKTMYILKQKNPAELTIEDIARCYVEGTAAYEDDPEARASITALNKEIYKINAENIHEGELAELYWQGRELSYEYFRDFYARIGVKFDKYYPESTVAGLGLSTVLRELNNGVYEKSDGAVVFDGEKYGLHTRVFVNREGVPTYEAKDVGLIFQKNEDYHFDRSVVITGAEQSEYMKVVLKSVEQYAPELVSKTSHLTHGLVKLPGNVKMSSRKGNFLKAVEVLELVAEELSRQYGTSDETVMLAAVKYAFLKYKMGGDIIFDPKESVSMTGNSGPYLLYSSVRAKKILQNVSESAHLGPSSQAASGQVFMSLDGSTSDTYVYNLHEKKLILKLMQYADVLAEAVAEMAPHKVAAYLYEVSKEFSRFYENCPVVGAPEEYERAELTRIYLETMTHGLEILGIEIPEEM